jgi:hypothetical protein
MKIPVHTRTVSVPVHAYMVTEPERQVEVLVSDAASPRALRPSGWQASVWLSAEEHNFLIAASNTKGVSAAAIVRGLVQHAMTKGGA